MEHHDKYTIYGEYVKCTYNQLIKAVAEYVKFMDNVVIDLEPDVKYIDNQIQKGGINIYFGKYMKYKTKYINLKNK